MRIKFQSFVMIILTFFMFSFSASFLLLYLTQKPVASSAMELQDARTRFNLSF